MSDNEPEYLFSSAYWLDEDKNRGYGRLAIPTSRDDEISNLIREWLKCDPFTRGQSAMLVNASKRSTLLAYCDRMASYAVRTSNSDWIVLGLVAQGLDGWLSDFRDNLTVVATHYDACERLRIAPAVIFSEAGKLLSPRVRNALADFVNRKPEERSLKAFGYNASADSDGFRYQRSW